MKQPSTISKELDYSVRITSPAHSEFNNKKLSFENLPKDWMQGLEKQNIKQPTPIQEFSYHPIMEGFDVLAQSLTGSGKTLAFSLPLAQKLANLQKKGKRNTSPKLLILTPTRELADQIAEVFESTLKSSQLRTATIIGGVSYLKQERALRSGLDVVVGTPGRIADLIKKKTLKLDSLNCYILDEVDQMLDIGFAKELDFIRENLPEKIQTLFFSATLNGETSKLAGKLLKDPVKVSVTMQNTSPQNIEHGYIQVKPHSKLKALVSCLVHYNPSQAIIFCETKKECSDVSHILNQKGFNASQLNSDLSQYERQLTMEQFRQGELQYLVATNVAARGIHIQELPLVLNYTPPKDSESYTHRVGRTGRAGASGKAWTLITPNEYHSFMRLAQRTKNSLTKISLPKSYDFIKKIINHELKNLEQINSKSQLNENDMSLITQTVNDLSEEDRNLFLQQILAQSICKIGIANPEKYEWTDAPMGFRAEKKPRRFKGYERLNKKKFSFRKNSSNRSQKPEFSKFSKKKKA